MTRQFDVVANPEREDEATRPYLIVLQADIASGLASTVVAPLASLSAFSGASRLNPVLEVEGRQFWLATHELFAIESRALGATIGNLAEQRYAIVSAIDFLFTGV